MQEQLLLLCALLAPLTQQLQQANVGVQGIAQADAGDEQGTWALECAQLLMSILQALSTHVHRPEDFQAKCLLQVRPGTCCCVYSTKSKPLDKQKMHTLRHQQLLVQLTTARATMAADTCPHVVTAGLISAGGAGCRGAR